MGFNFGPVVAKKPRLDSEDAKNESCAESASKAAAEALAKDDTSYMPVEHVVFERNDELVVPKFAIYGGDDDLPVFGIKMIITEDVAPKHDIISGKYEGGSVIWECSVDLVERLHAFVKPDIKNVLELGCGQALPAVHLAQKYHLDSLTLQDYNKEVLQNETTTVLQNATLKNPDTKISLVAGDWGGLPTDDKFSQTKYDVVILSECTYNKTYYDRLYSVLESTAKINPEVEIFIGMKEYYFGVGGSVHDWLKFVAKQKSFRAEEKWLKFKIMTVATMDATLKRVILKMVTEKQNDDDCVSLDNDAS